MFDTIGKPACHVVSLPSASYAIFADTSCTDDCFRSLVVSLIHSRLDLRKFRPGRVASLSGASLTSSSI